MVTQLGEKMLLINTCQEVKLQPAKDDRGDLHFLNTPFDVKRVFFISNPTVGAVRGDHAHKQLWELLIPLSGKFDLELREPKNDYEDYKKTIEVIAGASFSKGILINPMVWRRVKNFTKGAQVLSLCSMEHNELDYIRDQQLWRDLYKSAYGYQV